MMDKMQITCVRLIVPIDYTMVCTDLSLLEKISKEQLSLGIVQSCSVLLFLNDEVGAYLAHSIIFV